MKDKELRKLSRKDLLEMLLAQSREVEALKEQLKKSSEKLEDRRIMINNAGSIAEASLRLNGVFEAAQKAAEQYMENLQKQAEICAGMERESRDRAENLLSEAKRKCRAMESETQKKCDFMVKIAQEQAQKYWDNALAKAAHLEEAQTGLKELLNYSGFGRK